MSDLRIALIMGGGVSLGSFSAGALGRLLRLLEHVARGPARIDVVTGASAGSMTLAILLYHLYRGSPVEEIEGALRRAWVDRIEFDRLVPDLDRHDSPSLFSDAVVREIAGETLDFGRWEERVPSPYFSEGTLVSFALTNLNGVPVRAEGQLVRQPDADTGPATGPRSVFADAVQTTFHDDAIRFALCRTRADGRGIPAGIRVLGPWRDAESRAEWDVFREAAIASGAFPAAFPPVRIGRRKEEFAIWPEELGAEAFGFDYVDGGVLRNEPLREAIHLAAIRDEDRDDVERIFVLIDPNVSGTREVYSLAHNRLLRLATERDETGATRSMSLETPRYTSRLTSVLGRLVGVLASQAAFRDWLRAAKVNSQVEWRDELAGILAELSVPAGSGLEERMDRLLAKIYSEKVMRAAATSGPVDEGLVRARIAEDLAQRRDGLGDATAKLHLLLDLVANLREKRKINLVAITPSSTTDGRPLPIAGNFLSNFGGFFSEDYRAFDYAAGEFAASEVLNAPIGDARRLLKPSAPRLDRPQPPPIDPSYRSLAPAVQERLERLVGDHVRRFAAGVGVPSILRGVIAGKASSKVRAALIADHAAATADFLVEIEGAGGLTLRGVPGSGSLEADREGRIRTVVAVERRGGEADEPVHSFIGPHVSSNGILELVERRFLRPSRPRARVRLEGDPADWFHRARFAAMPVLRLRLEGDGEVVRGVGDVVG